MKIIEIFKDIFAPKKCYLCCQEGYFLCRRCLDKIYRFDSVCYICKEKTKHFSVHKACQQTVHYDKLIILAHYKDSCVKKLIKDAKYYGKRDILKDFGIYLGELFSKNEYILNKNDYIISAVPMHFMRKLKRGYNHSELLAKSISDQLGLVCIKNVVLKKRNTKQQSKLSKRERSINLQNSYKINKKYREKIENKIVILVDDVASTGSTINVISQLLKQNGAQSVIGLVIASD